VARSECAVILGPLNATGSQRPFRVLLLYWRYDPVWALGSSEVS
jgi:hypothetical protein